VIFLILHFIFLCNFYARRTIYAKMRHLTDFVAACFVFFVLCLF